MINESVALLNCGRLLCYRVTVCYHFTEFLLNYVLLNWHFRKKYVIRFSGMYKHQDNVLIICFCCCVYFTKTGADTEHNSVHGHATVAGDGVCIRTHTPAVGRYEIVIQMSYIVPSILFNMKHAQMKQIFHLCNFARLYYLNFVTVNRGDFGQICTIFINIFIMINWIQGFTWGLVSTM